MSIRSLFFLSFAAFMIASKGSAPAQAMLAEEPRMLKMYFNDPGRWPPEKRDPMERYAAAYKAAQPQLIQNHLNEAGLIERSYWLADMEKWSWPQAHQVRNALMKNRQPVRHFQSGPDTYIYLYPGGARVRYKLFQNKVYSVQAIAGEWDPGDLGRMPPQLWQNTKVHPTEKVPFLKRRHP
ncbi:MAG: hypothetical protein IGS03_06385 [Candidatus Sericytochromatia bacterium]|nr:hypothetical protein [Candidatus Sericytochromatia bacterium]